MTAGVPDKLPGALRAWRDAGERHDWEQGACAVFVRDVGAQDAPPETTLLVVHGFPESSFSFNKVLDALSAHFARVVLVDLPGYGFSDKPAHLTYSIFEQADALLSVWRTLGVSGGHVLAHDMGDSVTTELVARAVQGLLPGWFDAGLHSLTFTDGNMVMEEAALVPMQILLRKRAIGPVLNRLTRFSLFRNQVRQANGAAIEDADIEAMWRLNTLQNGHRLAWKIIRYLDERDRFQNPRWLNALSRYSGPVHLCWGEADRVSPPAVAQHLKRHVCPAAQLSLMPGVGHFCQLQAPQVWSEAVLGFYGSLGVTR